MHFLRLNYLSIYHLFMALRLQCPFVSFFVSLFVYFFKSSFVFIFHCFPVFFGFSPLFIHVCIVLLGLFLHVLIQCFVNPIH